MHSLTLFREREQCERVYVYIYICTHINICFFYIMSQQKQDTIFSLKLPSHYFCGLLLMAGLHSLGMKNHRRQSHLSITKYWYKGKGLKQDISWTVGLSLQDLFLEIQNTSFLFFCCMLLKWRLNDCKVWSLLIKNMREANKQKEIKEQCW